MLLLRTPCTYCMLLECCDIPMRLCMVELFTLTSVLLWLFLLLAWELDYVLNVKHPLPHGSVCECHMHVCMYIGFVISSLYGNVYVF